MGTPVVPPIAILSVSVRIISNLSACCSASYKYKVPASALVMRFAAINIASSRRLVSRSVESAMPMALSSSNLPNSGFCWIMFASGLVIFRPELPENSGLFNADCTHLVHIGDARQNLFNTVLLQRTHAFVEGSSEELCHTRMFLNLLFQ